MMCNQELCGLKCRLVTLYPQYKHLDRGDGICVHLDTETNLCEIYDIRPTQCKREDTYDDMPGYRSPDLFNNGYELQHSVRTYEWDT